MTEPVTYRNPRTGATRRTRGTLSAPWVRLEPAAPAKPLPKPRQAKKPAPAPEPVQLEGETDAT